MQLARLGAAIAVTPPRWCGLRADLLELGELGLSSRLSASNFARLLVGFVQVFMNRAPQNGNQFRRIVLCVATALWRPGAKHLNRSMA
jgi:hypothetical protein